MEAADCGKMLLYVRSIMWDLGIPQHAASLAYEDNDACTAMANAQKPTPRTRHIDIKYYAICEWVERDLLTLERISTAQNMADHFTKQLSPILFQRHVDYVMGRVPPQYSPCYWGVYESLQNTSGSTEDSVEHSVLFDIEPTPPAAAAAKFVVLWNRLLDHPFSRSLFRTIQ